MAKRSTPSPDNQAGDEGTSVELDTSLVEPSAPTVATSSLAGFSVLTGMPEGDLESLARAVLSELERRSRKPGDLSFPYRDIISDLQRRLADARAEARSGFGLHRPHALLIAERLHAHEEEVSEETKAVASSPLATEPTDESLTSSVTSEIEPEAPSAEILPGDAVIATPDAVAAESQDANPPVETTSDIEEGIRQAIENEVARLAR